MASTNADETSRFLEVWLELRQIVQAANFNRFHRAGLSATQFMTLNVIPEAGLTLSELARKLNLSAATLNATVNSLEERGLVQRSPHASDRRKVTIRATKTGVQFQRAASAGFHDFIANLFKQMRPGQRTSLVEGLEELVRLANGDASEPESSDRAGAGSLRAHNTGRSPRG